MELAAKDFLTAAVALFVAHAVGVSASVVPTIAVAIVVIVAALARAVIAVVVSEIGLREEERRGNCDVNDLGTGEAGAYGDQKQGQHGGYERVFVINMDAPSVTVLEDR